MSVKPVINNDQIKKYADLTVLAYPGFNVSKEELQERLIKTNSEDKDSIYYVYELDGKIVGGMRHIDYKINYNGNYIDASGVGMVAVDLLFKKQGIAKEMMEFYLEQSYKNKQYIAMLYAFRPDFYKKMGFGYGPKNYLYSFSPKSLNQITNKSAIVYLNGSDLPLLADCYLKYADSKHGFCKRNCFELNNFKQKYEKEGVVVGYKKNGHLDGYIYFTSEKIDKDNFIRHKMIIREWIYNTPEAFSNLAGFVEMQKDQYDIVVYQTQKEDFLFALSDVRMNDLKLYPGVSHKVAHQGMGMMYRIVDIEGFVNRISSYIKVNCPDITIALAIEDSFREKNQGVYYIKVKNREMFLSKESSSAVPIKMDIAEFSSLMMGSAKLRNLYDLNKVECNKKDLYLLECFFSLSEKPECITTF